MSLIFLLGGYHTRNSVRKLINAPNWKPSIFDKTTVLSMSFDPNNPNDSLTKLREELRKETCSKRFKRAVFEIKGANKPPLYLRFYDECFTLSMPPASAP